MPQEDLLPAGLFQTVDPTAGKRGPPVTSWGPKPQFVSNKMLCWMLTSLYVFLVGWGVAWEAEFLSLLLVADTRHHHSLFFSIYRTLHSGVGISGTHRRREEAAVLMLFPSCLEP